MYLIIHVYNNMATQNPGAIIAAHTAGAPVLSLPRKLALGAGDFGFNLYWQTASLFLLYFYTDVVGLRADVAGTLYMAALIWDGALDPLIGGLVDRTRTRWGRYRPYLLLGGVPLALIFVAMFAASGSGSALAVGLTAALHLGFRTVYAVVSIPYVALFARVTRDARLRADLAAIRIVFATSGALAVAVLTLPLVKRLGTPEDPLSGWIGLGAVFGGVATVMLLLAAWAVRRHDPREREPTPRYALIERLRALAANRALLLLAGSIMIGGACGTFFGKNLLYYFKYYIGRPELGGLALGYAALVAGLAVPLFGWLGRRWGKREAWLSGSLPSIVGLIGWGLLQPDQITLHFVVLTLLGIGGAASAVGFWSMLPDTVEYCEWKTGQQHESLVFGVAVFAQKVAAGIGAGALGLALQQVGYVANIEQSAATLASIRGLMVGFPLAGTVLAILLIWHYPLSLALHARINQELEARRAR